MKQQKSITRLKSYFEKTPSVIIYDSSATMNYYKRSADDWVVGISGSLNFAKTIKEEIKDFPKQHFKTNTKRIKDKNIPLRIWKSKIPWFLISRRKRSYTDSQLSTVKSGKTNRRPSYATVFYNLK